MARRLTVQYPGAIYHLMNRGDRREQIFKDDQDRKCFLETLAEACSGFGGFIVFEWIKCSLHPAPRPSQSEGEDWNERETCANMRDEHELPKPTEG